MNRNSIFNGANYFSRKDESRICYAFHLVIKYFKLATNEIVRVWKSKVLSDESIKPPATSDNSCLDKTGLFLKS